MSLRKMFLWLARANIYEDVVMEFCRAMTVEYLNWRVARIRKFTPYAYNTVDSIEEILADSSFSVQEIRRMESEGA